MAMFGSSWLEEEEYDGPMIGSSFREAAAEAAKEDITFFSRYREPEGSVQEYINHKPRNMVKTARVRSTAIRSLSYDSIRKDLKVTFRSGRTYIYTPVSQEFYEKMKKSRSKGRFYNRNVRNNEAFTSLKLIK